MCFQAGPALCCTTGCLLCRKRATVGFLPYGDFADRFNLNPILGSLVPIPAGILHGETVPQTPILPNWQYRFVRTNQLSSPPEQVGEALHNCGSIHRTSR